MNSGLFLKLKGIKLDFLRDYRLGLDGRAGQSLRDVSAVSLPSGLCTPIVCGLRG